MAIITKENEMMVWAFEDFETARDFEMKYATDEADITTYEVSSAYLGYIVNTETRCIVRKVYQEFTDAYIIEHGWVFSKVPDNLHEMF